MKVHKLRINYKSGISMEAEFKKFEFDGRTYEYEVYAKDPSTFNGLGPVLLGADDIESVWQISSREVKE